MYEINKNFNVSSYPALENCLFGAVKLTKYPVLVNTKSVDMVLDLIEKELFQ